MPRDRLDSHVEKCRLRQSGYSRKEIVNVHVSLMLIPIIKSASDRFFVDFRCTHLPVVMISFPFSIH